MTKNSGVAGSVVAPEEIVLEVLFLAVQKKATCKWAGEELLRRGYGAEKDENGKPTVPFKAETMRAHRTRWNKLWKDAGLDTQIPDLRLDDEVRSRGKGKRTEKDIANMAALFAGFANIDGATEQGKEIDIEKLTN